MERESSVSVTGRLPCDECQQCYRPNQMDEVRENVYVCSNCRCPQVQEEEVKEEAQTAGGGPPVVSRSKRLRDGSEGEKKQPNVKASPLAKPSKKVDLSDAPTPPYDGEDYFGHDLNADHGLLLKAQTEEVVRCSQTALTASQTVAGFTLGEQLFSFLNANKKPIRTFFLSHEKHLLLGIMDSLVRAIHATKDGPQRELLFCVFTAFPAIYCSRLRGGAEDRRRYTTFLRKRREHPDFTHHVLYLVKPKEEDDNYEEKPQTDDRSRKERIESLARRGKCRQALGALEESLALRTDPKVKILLQKLHPAPAEDYQNIFPPESEGGKTYFDRNELVEPFDRADLNLALRGLKQKVAPSMSGWTKEFFMMLMREASSTVMDFLPQFISDYVNLKLPQIVLTFSSNSFLFGLQKCPAPLAVRPVAVPCFLNKLAWKVTMPRVPKSQLEGTVQMGLSTQAGCQAALYTLQMAIKAGMIVLKTDSKNAFNTVKRSEFLKLFYSDKRYKAMWPLLHLNYQNVCYLVLSNGDIIFSQEGTRQGGVESSFVFSVALQSINELSKNRKGVSYVQIIDDIFIIVEPAKELTDNIPLYMDELKHHLAGLGLELCPGKTAILCQPRVWESGLLAPGLHEYRACEKLPNGEKGPPLDVYFCMGAALLLNFDGDAQDRLSAAIRTRIWGQSLAPYKRLQDLDVDLQLQHLIFQTSTIPSVGYLLGASWEHHDDKLYDQIREWYINHFMPLGDANDALLNSKSGPLTKALLHLPIGAGGGLGLPCPERTHYYRQDLYDPIHCHSDKYPWLDRKAQFAADFRQYRLPYCPPPMKDRPSREARAERPYSGNERLTHHFLHQIRDLYYNGVRHQRWMKAPKYRDTRVYKIPPECKRHRIENVTFRYGLAVNVYFVPGLTICEKCTNNTSPTRFLAKSQADVLDHVLHCPGCAASAITRRHNAINYAVKRVCRSYGIDYTLEPRGLPMPKKKNEEQQKETFKKQDGPDGLLNTHAGLTALEIHCPHQRLYTTDSEVTTGHYDSVTKARTEKHNKYSTFSATYPGIAVEVFTVSSGGVIHKDTVSRIKETWLPVAEQSGQGLLRMLHVEVAFEVCRAQGVVAQMAKTIKI
ncbi:MAG: hypothetical protein COB65_13770 [Thalassobium sp.]|nr:MAG: hypothetical protein COB65_13770 [Thalassobium sp.]